MLAGLHDLDGIRRVPGHPDDVHALPGPADLPVPLVSPQRGRPRDGDERDPDGWSSQPLRHGLPTPPSSVGRRRDGIEDQRRVHRRPPRKPEGDPLDERTHHPQELRQERGAAPEELLHRVPFAGSLQRPRGDGRRDTRVPRDRPEGTAKARVEARRADPEGRTVRGSLKALPGIRPRTTLGFRHERLGTGTRPRIPPGRLRIGKGRPDLPQRHLPPLAARPVRGGSGRGGGGGRASSTRLSENENRKENETDATRRYLRRVRDLLGLLGTVDFRPSPPRYARPTAEGAIARDTRSQLDPIRSSPKPLERPVSSVRSDPTRSSFSRKTPRRPRRCPSSPEPPTGSSHRNACDARNVANERTDVRTTQPAMVHRSRKMF
mmetsp:Transcript_21182/g.50286  ORF Transcript_21182/g.50286 Transcript_21182/m.50286 type:complete len:378 (+) Transcript_21182:706-1839(+)